jgi:AraC-like DNA-binding protein
MRRDTFHVQTSCSPGVMAVDACSARSFERHEHDEFGVGLVTVGAQRSGSGRGQVEAFRGNIITVNPAELHDGTPIGPARSWSMLYLTQGFVGSIVSDIEEGRRSNRELHAPVIDDPRLAWLFITTRLAALHPHGQPAFEERLLALFGGLLHVVQQSNHAPTSRLSRVREQIDDSPTSQHTLSDLAALAGLSRYQTVRGFARLTGLTPHAYVIQRRLDAARTLIRNGSTLAGAAFDAGFADQSHMHRVFIARHGLTPGAYAAAFRHTRAISFKTGAIRSA